MKAIFDPIIADIKDKVNEQVQAVMAKRLSENHPQEGRPKVMCLTQSLYESYPTLPRPFFL